MSDTVYAEEVNYWMTSSKDSDTWIEDAKREIKSVKGVILGEGFGGDASGRAAFMLMFQIGADQFKVMWPVLPSKTNKPKAAKVQAATMLYHDVKSKVVAAKVLGIRTAFFSYYLLPNGQTASEATGAEFMAQIPQLLSSGRQ